MSTKIQIRRGLAASWTSTNPVLSSGEIGFETDTYKLKIGNGSSTWTQLNYFADVLSASSSLISYVDQRVSSVIDGAPDLLNTLNELAAALGDNPDVLSSFITSSTASSIYLTQASFASASPNFSTDAELASAIVTASAAAVAYADGLTTADVAENTNLYFTNERAINAGSATYVTPSSTSTLTNKTINLNDNTFTEGALGASGTARLLKPSGTVRIVILSGNISNLSIGNQIVISGCTNPYDIDVDETFTIDSVGIDELSRTYYTSNALDVLLDPFNESQIDNNFTIGFSVSTPQSILNVNLLTQQSASATYILQTSQQGIINSASAAAVTAVLDGAPGALDTLNELAAALGDDSNFATTVTNSLSQKLGIATASATYATIESPTFTGTVTIPTLDLTNALPIADGGTGATTASAAFNALAPSQASNSGKYLTTNGTTTSWATVEGGGGASIIVSGTAPTGAVEGDAWFNNTTGEFYVYDGSFWVEVGQSGGGGTGGGGTASDDTIFKAQLFFGGSN